METMILLIVALAALCCMASNLALVYAALHQKKGQEAREVEKTKEELERERKELEAQRKDLEGKLNIFSYTGFPWKNGGKEE